MDEMTWFAWVGAIYVVLGVLLAGFARPAAEWDYKLDLKWKFMLMFDLKFRIRYLRISGILMALMGLTLAAVCLIPFYYS